MMKRMNAEEKIAAVSPAGLTIIHYPDPRLREACSPIEQANGIVAELAERMKDLMFRSKGVGLAAPQVGVTVRLFLASPGFDPADVHVYINPRIIDTEGNAEGEEGCLSFPNIFCKVKRSRTVTVEAVGLDGEPFRQTVSDLHARIVQHEIDHLDGRLLVDRMGSVAKLSHRKALSALEAEYAGAR